MTFSGFSSPDTPLPTPTPSRLQLIPWAPVVYRQRTGLSYLSTYQADCWSSQTALSRAVL